MQEQADRKEAGSAQSFRIVLSSDGLGVVEVGSVCIVVWQSAVTPERFERERVALEDHVARHADASLILVIEPETTRPTIGCAKPALPWSRASARGSAASRA